MPLVGNCYCSGRLFATWLGRSQPQFVAAVQQFDDLCGITLSLWSNRRFDGTGNGFPCKTTLRALPSPIAMQISHGNGVSQKLFRSSRSACSPSCYLPVISLLSPCYLP